MQATVIQDLGNRGDAGNLPRAAQVRANPAPTGAESRPEIRLLLVEDDLAFVSVLTRFLMTASRAKFRVKHAGTKAAALERLAAREFDVVLLDLTLPDSPKEATFESILSHAPNLPIVIMSGSDDEELAMQTMQAGAQDYLVKGDISLSLLVRVIHHAIERKRLEVSLIERELFYRLITENAHDLIAVLDRDGRRIYNSPSYQRLLSAPPEIHGSNSLENVHPDDAARIRQIFRETVATGVGQRTEYRFVCTDGSIRYIESQGSVIKDEFGEVAKVLVVSRDVTQRKRAEESLRESEQRYKQLLGSVTDYIYTVELDGQGRVLATRHNPSCVAVTGYTAEEFAATPGLGMGMVPFEDRPAVEAMIAEARRGGETEPIEHRLRHKDGSLRWVRATTVPRKNAAGTVSSYDGLVSDITERREADNRLRQSEALYQSLVANLPQCIMRKDRDGRFIFVNQRFAEMLHAKPADVIGRTDFDFYPPAMAEKFTVDDRRVMASGQMFETIEENLTANGVLHDVQVLKIPVRDPSGEVNGVQCIFWDVTASRRAQGEIQRRDELLQAMMDNTPAVIYLKDLEGRYLYINREFEKLFNVQRERTVAKTDFDIFPSDIAQRFQENDRAIIEDGCSRTLDEQAPQADGLHDYLSVKFPVRDVHGRPYALCGISTDITDRKQIETQLQQRNRELRHALRELQEAKMYLGQSEKLRAVGTLAAGVAHEVKNPLQELLLNASGLELLIGDKIPEAREQLVDMRASINQANTIVCALLDYARPDPLQLNREDINQLIQEVLLLNNYSLLDARVAVVVHYDRVAPRLMLDRQKMKQVFMNLITNAIHAMEGIPEKGRRIEILVTTQTLATNERLPRGLGDTTCWMPGDDLVVVELSDTGPGIPARLLTQIFDPFFTTKGPGKGTGLGLHIVQNIVGLHGGTIDISNRPEGGARARITLNPKKGSKHHEKEPHPRS